MTADVEQMKWWGWGTEGTGLNMDEKPGLWPFINSVLGIEGDGVRTPPVPLESIDLPPQTINAKFVSDLRSTLREDQIRTDRDERIIHTYGKSFRDLWRIRNGVVETCPDAIVYPESERDVVAAIRAASEYDVVIIPFGGGSNIAGCLETMGANGRMAVSLDLKRMNKVLAVDRESCTARIEAGVLGPHLEHQLKAHGVTLGHFPDSFIYSSLGGWIATRSAGMQSDKYGKIEDMVLSLRMVTPQGTIATRTVPKSSNGIDVNQICIGSEGILGVITEATMQVHRTPEIRDTYGYLFPNFESGVEAVHRCVEKECIPAVTRLNDPAKTALSFAYKSRTTGFKNMISQMFKLYLRRFKRYDMDNVCLMIIAIEGDKYNFGSRLKRANSIYRSCGGVGLGTAPGRAFEKGKYDFPHLRDIVMDRGIMADVSETSTVWSNLVPLYQSTMDRIDRATRETGSKPYLGSHISHTYRSGASLYFTFGCVQNPGRELEQYLTIKKAAEDAFIEGGATLSHHHAVGFEHLPWVEDDVSAVGIKAVRAIKTGLDPDGIMNPGKIIPSKNPLANWGLERYQPAGG